MIAAAPSWSDLLPAASLRTGEIVVDLFAGGGGASTGIEAALGQDVFVAVNHDPAAIAMHTRNHPFARHFCESVFDVDPVTATSGRPVGLLWTSPDCTDFSRAKGGKPRKKEIRGLAWVVVTWAAAVAPRVIMLENVPEFEGWGPLDNEGRRITSRSGETFREFVGQLEALGYAVEWRTLNADTFGAPTIRRRFHLIARRDGLPIDWPAATHGDGPGLYPRRSAASCIDWAIPCPSIFLSRDDVRAQGLRVKRPLAANTCRRIASGVMRYVVNHPRPFLAPVPTSITADRRSLIVPFLSKYYSSNGQQDHCHGIDEPFGTVTAIDHHALVAVSLIQSGYGERLGQSPRILDIESPLGTVVGGGCKHALVSAFLVKYYGNGGQWQAASDPLHTITGKARLGVVTVVVDGQTYAIADIGMRMMSARELATAQGFDADYVLPDTEVDAIERIGNSVCPPVAAALVAANFMSQRHAAQGSL